MSSSFVWHSFHNTGACNDVYLEAGTRGLVPCGRTDINASRVLWSRDPPPIDNLVTFIFDNKGVWTKYIPDDYEGLYDIDQDFNLIIQNVRLEDEGTYYCTLEERDSFNRFNVSRTVTLFGKKYAGIFKT